MNHNRFREELNILDISLTKKQEEQLNRYYQLIVEYNKIMNLTGIVEESEVYLKHFYDSLTIVRGIDLNEENTLCDMGTGAGLPGIVLKIVFPHLKVTLLDSLNKRIKFLKIVIKELDLLDTEAIHCRVEEYGMINREVFDVVTARAVAPTNILLEYASAMVKVGKYFVAMKGNIEKEENCNKALEILNFKLLKTDKFLLPEEKSNRTLIVFKKINNTSNKFPRKFSEIKKNPL